MIEKFKYSGNNIDYPEPENPYLRPLGAQPMKQKVQKNYLYKQKVKDVIDRMSNNQILNRMSEISKCSNEIRNILNQLKKELRLK